MIVYIVCSVISRDQHANLQRMPAFQIVLDQKGRAFKDQELWLTENMMCLLGSQQAMEHLLFFLFLVHGLCARF